MAENRITKYMRSDAVLAEFQEVLGHSTNSFVSSVLITVANDERLQQCTPASIYVSAMKAANVGLSVSSELGHAYLVAYKNKGTLEAQFQPSYKGLKQLAMGSGKYRFINSSPIYEGERIVEDRITGKHTIEGNKKSNKVEGWISSFELVSGYGKSLYMTVDEIHAHALKNNPGGYNSASGAWKRYKKGDKQNVMEQKTPLRLLLMRDGYLTPAQVSILQDEDIEEPIDVIPEDLDDAEAEVVEETKRTEEESVDILMGTKSKAGPLPDVKVNGRPYSAEEVKEKVSEKVAHHLKEKTTASINDRKVLASILDTVLTDVTKRYELCKWLVGQSSTQKMKQADVNALFDWLGTPKTFSAMPSDEVVKEIHAAHTAALKDSGQQELI